MCIAVLTSRMVGGEPSSAIQARQSHPAGSSFFVSSISLVISTADCCQELFAMQRVFGSMRERQNDDSNVENINYYNVAPC